MTKKYMIFISSTYSDLIDERSSVLKVILEMDHIPAGMELFQASNEDQWNLITDVIDRCDYYIIIVGGRYGSPFPNEEISYTEKEFRYAIDKNIPILGFIHEHPETIQSKNTDPENKKQLTEFVKLVKKRPIKHWTNPDDLSVAVATSLIRETNRNEQIGWIRADDQQPIDMDLLLQINELNNELREKDNIITNLRNNLIEPLKVDIQNFENKFNLLNLILRGSIRYKLTDPGSWREQRSFGRWVIDELAS